MTCFLELFSDDTFTIIGHTEQGGGCGDMQYEIPRKGVLKGKIAKRDLENRVLVLEATEITRSKVDYGNPTTEPMNTCQFVSHLRA